MNVSVKLDLLKSALVHVPVILLMNVPSEMEVVTITAKTLTILTQVTGALVGLVTLSLKMGTAVSLMVTQSSLVD